MLEYKKGLIPTHRRRERRRREGGGREVGGKGEQKEKEGDRTHHRLKTGTEGRGRTCSHTILIDLVTKGAGECDGGLKTLSS